MTWFKVKTWIKKKWRYLVYIAVAVCAFLSLVMWKRTREQKVRAKLMSGIRQGELEIANLEGRREEIKREVGSVEADIAVVEMQVEVHKKKVEFSRELVDRLDDGEKLEMFKELGY